MHFKIYSNQPSPYREASFILVYEHDDGRWKRVIKFDDIATAPVTGKKWIAVPIFSKYHRHKNERLAGRLKLQYKYLVFDSKRATEMLAKENNYYEKLATKRYYYYKELEERLSKYEEVPYNPTV